MTSVTKIIKSSAKYVNETRVFLERKWDSSLPCITILMYKPSTADALINDKTITSCIKIAGFNNYGGIKVYNININDLVTPNIPSNIPPNIPIVLAWGMKINKKKSRHIIDKLFLSHELLCFVQLKNGSPGLPTRLNHETVIKPYIRKLQRRC